MLPDTVTAVLRAHLQEVQRLHAADRAAGFGRVVLPDALARKFPSAVRMAMAVRVSGGAP